MPRSRSLAVIFLLVAAAATSGHAAMNRAKPSPTVLAPVKRISADPSSAVYIDDIVGKRVRLVGPHFMPDPAHRRMVDGRPARIDQL